MECAPLIVYLVNAFTSVIASSLFLVFGINVWFGLATHYLFGRRVRTFCTALVLYAQLDKVSFFSVGLSESSPKTFKPLLSSTLTVFIWDVCF